MQQIDAHEPVAVAPVHAAADTHRRNAGNVGAIGEGGANDIELVLDAPDAAMKRPDVVLALEFAAAENGVALRIDRLVQFDDLDRSGIEVSSHVLPVSRRKMKPLNWCSSRSASKRNGPVARRNPTSTDFAVSMLRLGLPMSKVRGRVVRAARKQLRRLGRAFDILRRDAGDQIIGQILDQADAGALRREMTDCARCRPIWRDCCWAESRGNSGVVPLSSTCSMRPAI